MLLFAVYIEGMKHTNTPEMWHGIFAFFHSWLACLNDEWMNGCTCLVNTCSFYFTSLLLHTSSSSRDVVLVSRTTYRVTSQTTQQSRTIKIYVLVQAKKSKPTNASKQEMQPEIAHMYTRSENSLTRRTEQNRTNRTIVYKPSIAKKRTQRKLKKRNPITNA